MPDQIPKGPIPVLMAMLLCDMVITDPDTGKKTLVGIFDRLSTLQFPTKRTMAVYAKLTDAQGKYIFRLQFIDIDRDQVLGEVQSEPIEISSRLEPFQFALPITVGAEHPGLYEFRLYANDTYIGRVPFWAAQITSEGG